MLETTLLILAGCGLLAIIIGRHLMIRDTGGDLPLLWMIALRLVPFSELIFMVRHFKHAKKGGLIAIAGMWLMVPYAGVRLWERQNQMKETIEEIRDKITEGAGRNGEGELTSAKFGELSGEGASGYAKYQARLLAEKEKLVAQLNARIAWWHEQLQQRRTSLIASDTAAVADFSAEAAAYARLNAIAKEKVTELVAQRSTAKR